MFYAKYLSARGPFVKYPANKVNPYLDKVISAQRANVKWLCEEQFKCATLILTRSFSGSCSDDFRRKVFGKFVGIFVIFTQRLLYAFEMKALIVLAQSFLALAQESMKSPLVYTPIKSPLEAI